MDMYFHRYVLYYVHTSFSSQLNWYLCTDTDGTVFLFLFQSEWRILEISEIRFQKSLICMYSPTIRSQVTFWFFDEEMRRCIFIYLFIYRWYQSEIWALCYACLVLCHLHSRTRFIHGLPIGHEGGVWENVHVHTVTFDVRRSTFDPWTY